MVDERVLLDDSLRPIWTFFRFTGLLPDFWHRQQKTRLRYFIHTVITFLAALFLITFLIIKIVSLYYLIHHSQRDIFIIVPGTISSLFALYFLCHYLKFGDEFSQLFNDWRAVEVQTSDHFTVAKKKRTAKIIYSYALIVFILSAILFYRNELSVNRELFPFYWSSLIMIVGKYYVVVYLSLGEVVPALFFYHVGCVVQDIQRQLQENFFPRVISFNNSAIPIDNAFNSNFHVQLRNVNTFQRVWEKYETVLGFVDRANQLLGASILCIDFTSFILMCLPVYTVLQTVPMPRKLFVFCANLFSIWRIVCLNRLISHPTLAQEELKTSLAALLSRKWQLLCEDDRILLVAFQARLDSGKLAASPYNLYNVKPSNILSMLSLIVTYVIVIIQFDW